MVQSSFSLLNISPRNSPWLCAHVYVRVCVWVCKHVRVCVFGPGCFSVVGTHFCLHIHYLAAFVSYDDKKKQVPVA